MAEWMVRSEGSDPIGPVTTELLLRGIALGRVPVESEVQQLGSGQWQILEFVDPFADAIQSDEAMTRLAESPLDDSDILAYADAEEAFTRLAVPAASPGPSAKQRPAHDSARLIAKAGPAGSGTGASPAPRLRAPNPAAYDEDEDAATRVASSPFDSGPPSIPAAAFEGPGWQTSHAVPSSGNQSSAPRPGPSAPLHYASQIGSGSGQQQPAPMAAPPRAASSSAVTWLLGLMVLVLAGCLGLLLWLLSTR